MRALSCFFPSCHLLVITWQETASLLGDITVRAMCCRFDVAHTVRPQYVSVCMYVWVWNRRKVALVLICRTLFPWLRLEHRTFVTLRLLWCHRGHLCRSFNSWGLSKRLILSQLSRLWLYEIPQDEYSCKITTLRWPAVKDITICSNGWRITVQYVYRLWTNQQCEQLVKS